MAGKYITHDLWSFGEILTCLLCTGVVPFVAKGMYNLIADIFAPYNEVTGRIEKREIKRVTGLRTSKMGYFITVAEKAYEINKKTYDQLQAGQKVIIKLSKHQEEISEVYAS